MNSCLEWRKSHRIHPIILQVQEVQLYKVNRWQQFMFQAVENPIYTHSYLRQKKLSHIRLTAARKTHESR